MLEAEELGHLLQQLLDLAVAEVVGLFTKTTLQLFPETHIQLL